MTAPQRPAASRRLPAYALYGEAGIGVLGDRLHCESIAERSRLHGWEIRPHRHEALFQLLVIECGQARVTVDGDTLALEGPAVVAVPALTVHGFRFAPEIRGHVFTVADPHLAALLQPHGGLAAALMRARGAALASAAAATAEVLAAAAALRDETLGHAGWRGAALDAALLRLAVAVARAVPLPPGDGAAAPPPAALPARRRGPLPGQPVPARALAHVQRLRLLVEAQFRSQPTQAALAAQLGITPTQLNRACQQVLGHRAQDVLHARLLLQAQRDLAYTDLGIKQIAYEAGFADAAYFTRFFRRLTGQTPVAWRAARRLAPGAASAAP